METAIENGYLSQTFRNTGNPDRLVRKSGSNIEGGESLTGEQVMDFLKAQNWTEVTNEVAMQQTSFGACRYFRANLTNTTAYMSVASIEALFYTATGMSIDHWDQNTTGEQRETARLLGEQVLNSIQLSWGAHGPELVTDLKTIPCNFIVMAIGNPNDPNGEHDGTQVIYTWHPGMPVAPSRISTATIKLS